MYVWDSVSLEARGCLRGVHQGGVICLDFSPDGSLVLSVGDDMDHTLCVWDWKRERALAVAKGSSQRIMQARFHPENGGLLTVGDKHIKVWRLESGKLYATKGQLERKGTLQAFACVEFVLMKADSLDKRKDTEKKADREWGDAQLVYCAVTGNQDGGLYVWLEGRLVVAKKAAHQGPILVLSAPRSAAAADGAQMLLSGGVDGVVRRWDVSRSGRFQQVRGGEISYGEGRCTMVWPAPSRHRGEERA